MDIDNSESKETEPKVHPLVKAVTVVIVSVLFIGLLAGMDLPAF